MVRGLDWRLDWPQHLKNPTKQHIDCCVFLLKAAEFSAVIGSHREMSLSLPLFSLFVEAYKKKFSSVTSKSIRILGDAIIQRWRRESRNLGMRTLLWK